MHSHRIRKIENLDGLTKLDVLDLHGNKVFLVNFCITTLPTHTYANSFQ